MHIPTITEEEDTTAFEKLGGKKAPWLDAVPKLVLKAMLKANRSGLFSLLRTISSQAGIFPT